MNNLKSLEVHEYSLIMKVLQVSPYFPPHMGGVEYHVKGLADGLAGRGYSVRVASSCGTWEKNFTRIPSIDLLYAPLPLHLPKVAADIYHSHIPSPFFAFMLRKKSPHVVTYHNDVVVPTRLNGYRLPPLFGKSLEWVNRRLVKPILDEAEIVVATTKSYAETSPVLQDYLHKVRIVPNAVDCSLFPSDRPKKGYVLYVGRLVNYKGVESLLVAMSIVQKSAKLGLVLAGDGYDRSRLQNMAIRLGVKAVFTGRLKRSRLIDLMSRAEMLVLPTTSRLEAFGIVLLEAMACEVPVLAFDTPGVNEVACQGGRVFTSTGDLAESILELHESEPLRQSLGRRGRQAVQEKYSWKSVLDKIESVYEEVA
jgi:glycosyltransferase involved in cell wall biosynthesis